MRWIFFLFIFSTLCSTQIRLGDQILTVEIADTTPARAKGLMGRKTLGENQGMLFIYPKAEKLSFWMKNTLIPLSIAFFDEKKRLLEIIDMMPETLDTHTSWAPAQYALEMNQGWFEKKSIQIGTKFSFLDRGR